MKIRLLSPAEEDYAESMLYYLEKSPASADEFIEEVESALKEIADFPYRYAIRESDIRAKVLTLFPFTIYYRILSDEVVVSTINHQNRDVEHWRER